MFGATLLHPALEVDLGLGIVCDADMVLTSALDARIIAASPLAGIGVPTVSSRPRNALTVEQVEALAATVDPWWRPFVLVLAYCGLRPGEAAALRRRHLDDFGRLTIEGGISEHRGQLLERDTKTHRARIVEVPASVLAVLREHIERNCIHRSDVLLFTTPTGEPVRLSNWRHRVWNPAAKARVSQMGNAICHATHRRQPPGSAGRSGLRCCSVTGTRPSDLPSDLRAPVSG